MSIANELITRGWTQGHFEHEETGAVCLMGAACRALLGKSWLTAGWGQTEEIEAKLSRMLPEGWVDVADFNDKSGRTFDEVLRFAKEADEILDAG